YASMAEFAAALADATATLPGAAGPRAGASPRRPPPTPAAPTAVPRSKLIGSGAAPGPGVWEGLQPQDPLTAVAGSASPRPRNGRSFRGWPLVLLAGVPIFVVGFGALFLGTAGSQPRIPNQQGRGPRTDPEPGVVQARQEAAKSAPVKEKTGKEGSP